MSVIALIPAAGCGRRFGSGVKKQFLRLRNRPVLVHTLELFQHLPLIDEIFPIVADDEVAFCRQEIVDRFQLTKVAAIVAGGAERRDSVANGLFACCAAPDDIVVIHDGVRPLCPPALLEDVVRAAKEWGAVLAAVPAKDTLKEVRKGFACGTPDRCLLWHAQTPQAFRFDLIRKAYEKGLKDDVPATDDAFLVERLGLKVRMIEGSYRNLKITTPEDLIMAEAFLAAQEVTG